MINVLICGGNMN